MEHYEFNPPKYLHEYEPIDQDAIKIMAQSKQNMIPIYVSDTLLKDIHIFSRNKEIEKYGEDNHENDHGNEYKRCFTGMMGEVALEQLFGVQFVDWTVGPSYKYNFPDLLKVGYKIGIKTVEFGKMPVVYKYSKDPELICVRRDTNTILLCGLALPSVLNNNLNIDFVKSANIRREGKKSAFVGFDQLIKIEKLTDLDPYNKTNTYNKYRR